MKEERAVGVLREKNACSWRERPSPIYGRTAPIKRRGEKKKSAFSSLREGKKERVPPFAGRK